MTVRRHRQLDLPALRQLAIALEQPVERLPHYLQQLAPRRRVERSLVLQQCLDARQLFQRVAQPGDVVPSQQVQKELLVHIGQTVFVDPFAVERHHHVEQAAKTRVDVDHQWCVRAPAGAYDLDTFSRIRRYRFNACEQVQQRIRKAACGLQVPLELLSIVVELFEQNRCEVHHAAHLRVRFQVSRHVYIVLQRMQIDPGQAIVAVLALAVPGLVHMPTQHQIDVR